MRRLAFLGVTVLTVLSIVPLYFMVSASFQHVGSIMVMPPPMIPYRPTLRNFAGLMNNNLIRSVWNTAWMGAVVVAISTMVASMAGYAVSVFRHRWALPVFMAAMLIPANLIFIPLYVTAFRFYRLSEWAAVLTPYVFSAAGVLVYSVYFDTVPRALIDSARLDGASEWAVLTRIMIPLCRPVAVYFAIGQFVGFYTNLVWQVLTLQSFRFQTFMVNLYLNVMMTTWAQGNAMGRMLAMGTVMLVPLIFVYLVLSRYIVSERLVFDMGGK